MQNVVDGAITIAMYFIVGFAFASNSGSPFIGTEVCFAADAALTPPHNELAAMLATQ